MELRAGYARAIEITHAAGVVNPLNGKKSIDAANSYATYHARLTIYRNALLLEQCGSRNSLGDSGDSAERSDDLAERFDDLANALMIQRNALLFERETRGDLQDREDDSETRSDSLTKPSRDSTMLFHHDGKARS